FSALGTGLQVCARKRVSCFRHSGLTGAASEVRALGSHGTPVCSGETDFGPQIENLNKKLFTVVAWDPRGYGHSRPPDRDFPVDFFERDAKDAIDLMKTLNFKKVSLLGWSDGGITALIAAARYPSYVSKMVIWGANAYVTEQDTEIYQGLQSPSKSWQTAARGPGHHLSAPSQGVQLPARELLGLQQPHLPRLSEFNKTQKTLLR
ncbi:hypothetical protein FD754_024874, partial [Muntiacus muntjak]